MTLIHLSNSASIPANYITRHTIITGPTGTGKTVTLTKLIHSLVTSGTPVFAPDVKGDIGPGNVNARVPIWAFGADLLARAFELTEIQAGVLEIVFAWADETDQALDTLDDLRAALAALARDPDRAAHLGHVTRASIGTIQRACLRLEKQGASNLFGPHGFDVADWTDKPALHVLDASQLYHTPRLYGALLLYILRDLSKRLPEVGDIDRPRLVLVFDEAHTIFHEASPALLSSVEATARLIRSKGVGLIWASQSPEDIPRVIRDQCATTIRHSRDLGIGRCGFASMGSPERVISPDMASLDGLSAPATPAPVLTIAPEPVPFWLNMLGLALIALPVALLIGLGAALYAGYASTIIGLSIAFYLATR